MKRSVDTSAEWSVNISLGAQPSPLSRGDASFAFDQNQVAGAGGMANGVASRYEARTGTPSPPMIERKRSGAASTHAGLKPRAEDPIKRSSKLSSPGLLLAQCCANLAQR